MKNWEKLLFFVFLLIFAAFSVCALAVFYPVPYVSDTVTFVREAYFWADYIFAGACAAMALVFMVLMLVTLFFPTVGSSLAIKTDKGKLVFTKKTFESVVRYSYGDIYEVSTSSVKVLLSPKPDKIRVDVKLAVNGAELLSSIAESVQARIAATLSSSLGITVKRITVKVADVNTNYTPKTVAEPPVSVKAENQPETVSVKAVEEPTPPVASATPATPATDESGAA